MRRKQRPSIPLAVPPPKRLIDQARQPQLSNYSWDLDEEAPPPGVGTELRQAIEAAQAEQGELGDAIRAAGGMTKYPLESPSATTVSEINPLLAQPTHDQYAVLNTIYGQLEQAADWPIWQYVDHAVRPVGCAWPALRSMPLLKDTRVSLGWKYSWAWWDEWGLGGGDVQPRQDTQVKITVAGMWALRFGELPHLYVRLLRLCHQRWLELPRSPTQVQYVQLSSDEVRDALSDKNTRVDQHRLTQLRQILQGESRSPLYAASVFQDGTWTLQVRENITEWSGIETVEDYLNRMMELIPPARGPIVKYRIQQPTRLDDREAVYSTQPAVPEAAMAVTLAQEPRKPSLRQRWVSRSFLEHFAAIVLGGLVLTGILGFIGWMTHVL